MTNNVAILALMLSQTAVFASSTTYVQFARPDLPLTAATMCATWRPTALIFVRFVPTRHHVPSARVDTLYSTTAAWIIVVWITA